MTIDRSKHDHGLHNLDDRHADTIVRAMRDHMPLTGGALHDLKMVIDAKRDPHVADGSLQGSVKHWLENGNDHLREGQSAHGGNNYEWDGEELAKRFCK